MESMAKNELYSIRRDLDSVIQELEFLSTKIRNEFEGIGNYKCADCIDKSLENCNFARKKLYNLDTSTITEHFARIHNIVQH